MATLVLTAVGTAIGGPIGGALGSLVGSQIDGALFKPKAREGARLKELSLTTSSYGTPIARHFGAMRVAGSVIWATDLVESSEKVGGGKGQPSTKVYSYAGNFAVALGSRPIASLGRIWADGKLLRGAAGDLKVGGELRVYTGHGDQQRDPLIASAEGANCPAFRGLAYCVFEGLQLADFGNRIPALSFEVFADTGPVTFASLLEELDATAQQSVALEGLEGYSDEGGPLAQSLDLVASLYPFSCDASGDELRFAGDDLAVGALPILPEAVSDPDEESFGARSGQSHSRRTNSANIPSGLRYYDSGRDYQAGLQRAGGRALPGRNSLIEFPGSLNANIARQLADKAAARASRAREVLHYRVAELDGAIGPGVLVQVPGRNGAWRIASWEWRSSGIELELVREPTSLGAAATTDAGRSLPDLDAIATPTILRAAELPWDGEGSPDERQVIVAPSSTSSGWTGAMIYTDIEGSLTPIRASGRARSVIGSLTSPLIASQPHILARQTSVDVQLVSEDFALSSQSPESLAGGANRALIGSELVQFANIEPLGGALWRLSGLLRGRGGTEALAQSEHPAGTPFILLSDDVHLLTGNEIGTASALAAIGLADEEPASAGIADIGRTLRPLSPVHPRVLTNSDGSITLCWTRRARGAWRWEGTVEPALAEQSELYEIGVGEPDQPAISWQTSAPSLALTAQQYADAQASHAGAPIWVRQIGSHDRSPPLLLLTL